MPEKRETCKWANHMAAPDVVFCTYPVPANVIFLSSSVYEDDCANCPCWSPKVEESK